MDAAPTPPGLEFVFRITIEVAVPIDQGVYEGQRHRIVPILGGTVAGPGFDGVVLAAGADWQTLRETDGNTRALARYVLQHADGSLVAIENPGIRCGPAEVMARLAAGERVDPSSYYFRTSPRFDVAPGPHDWLTRATFVGVGRRWPERVEIDVHKVL